MLTLRVGPPPENAALVGDAAWKPIAGYDTAGRGALRMLAVSIACALVAFGLWTALVPGSLQLRWPPISSALAVLVTLVVLHEVIHLLAFPGGGFGRAVAGFWPAKGAAYVLYTLPIFRNRFVLATLAPSLILSAGVLAVAVSGAIVPAPLQWASVLNAFGSGADLLLVYLLVRQSSSSALVLESGQGLYTREA